MARPKNDKKTRKATQELLDEQNLYRAIKAHREVKEYDLTISEIKAVFRAFADIVYNAVKMEIRVNLPYIGEFYQQKMKGWKGGNIKIADKPFTKGSEYHDKYFPPTPDYGLIQFELRKSIKDRFKKETEVD